MPRDNENLVKFKARLAFPAIFEPFGEDGKYNACLILNPEEDAETITKLRKLAGAIVKDKWRGKVKNEKQLKQFFLKDGDTKAEHDGFEGNVYVSASNAIQPTIVDRTGKRKLDKKDGVIYAGCYVIAYVQLWAQDNQYGKGVNATLRGIQFFEDGEPFAGAPPMDLEEFEELEPFEDDEEEEFEDLF